MGTFIQQEVGKLEDDTSGSFFKQIDSSPVGGETDEVTVVKITAVVCPSLQPQAPQNLHESSKQVQIVSFSK